MNNFYKTKLTVEFDIETQHGPESAGNMIDVLTRVPAITNVKIVKVVTNYEFKDAFPKDANLKFINSIPKTIR